MNKHRTPDELRQMAKDGLRAIGQLTPELERIIDKQNIPERGARLNLESEGIITRAFIAVRHEEIAWFNMHPTETHYFRRAVKGEFPPDVTAGWVRVVKVDPKAIQRIRTPMVRVSGPNDIEWREWSSKSIC